MSSQLEGGDVPQQNNQMAVIEIDGPGANLLNPGVMSAVRTALIKADEDEAVGGIILTGSGGAFCGGLDLDSIKAGGDPVEFASALVELLRIFPRFTTPVAAVINGDALASGAALVAVCDYAAIVPTASIGSYEVAVGVWPTVAQVAMVHRMGARAAMENIGSGVPFTPVRARELGLVNAVVEMPAIMAHVRGWLENAARAGRASAGRATLYKFAELSYDDALDQSLTAFAAQFVASSLSSEGAKK